VQHKKELIVRNCNSELIGENPYFSKIWYFGEEMKNGLSLN